ncbi:unnamed protein product (macronuclear) [Paramecium tetraurelia]|uniref:PIPK domain-containing protein n=1 Tax=Paramecium tetraurelia TaxID=5888 RepID=A0C747_PARTE|nr:uncharacterized protein GSPATT00035744001 [Paramecium tetraurelia]CAK66614.1 unnamed protein product [Paramecium tetraurelia]|eukprot:XP_001434011.1 hypothetical protein (macronuclear) [Paramecium tetraurelia strain d4-2]
MNKVTVAYICIGCITLSVMACLLICILGIVSPIYRKYPSKCYFSQYFRIIVWISCLYILLGVFLYIDQTIVIIYGNNPYNHSKFNKIQMLTSSLIGITITLISNQFILFLNEVKICIYNPFQATSSSVFIFLLLLQCLLTMVMIVIPLLLLQELHHSNTNAINTLNDMASYINFVSCLICTLFYIAIWIILNKNKTLQSRRLYEFKSDFVKQQFYWISAILAINIITSFDNYNLTKAYEQLVLKIALSLEGLFFAIFHLIQPYSYHKLLSVFFRSFQDQSYIQDIENIEYGLNTDIHNRLIPTYEKLLKTQINELVKGLVKAVFASLIMQFDHHLKEREIKRTYTFKFHLSELNESRISLNEEDDVKDSIILVNTYYPNGFTSLLKLNNFNKSILEYTLELQYNYKAFEQAKESMGRSGAFFFYSQNHKLILKTVEKSEIKDFLDGRIGPYFDHINYHNKSLIAKIYGIFKIKLMAYKTQYLVLMENSFEQMQNLEHEYEIYDLKGSTINRTSRSDERVKKDNNFKQSTRNPISLPKEISNEIKKQFMDDCRFLRDIGYMDYSLLLGICLEKPQQINNNDYRLVTNGAQNTIYSFSIIDYLQRFNYYKKSEQCFKRSIQFKKKKDLSCRSPEPYCQRFLNFIDSIIV